MRLSRTIHRLATGSLTALAVAGMTNPALAGTDILYPDNSWTGPVNGGGLCAQSTWTTGKDVGWGWGVAVGFQPKTVGEVAQVTVVIEDPFGRLSQPDAPDAIFHFGEASTEGPSVALYATANVSAATILASPLDPTGLGHEVTVTLPPGSQVASPYPGAAIWMVLNVGDTPTVTDYCMMQTMSGEQQYNRQTLTWHDNFAGYSNDWSETGDPFLLTDSLRAAHTKLVVAPFVRYQFGTLVPATYGYKASLQYHNTVQYATGSFPNQTVKFYSGNRLACTAVTDVQGDASCTSSVLPTLDGYTATFDGDTMLMPSRGTAPLVDPALPGQLVPVP